MSSRGINESFRKRRHNFSKRGNELSQGYGAKVYVCIERHNQVHIFNSHPSDQEWPPSKAKQVWTYQSTCWSTLSLQKTMYPIPVMKTPKDFVYKPKKPKKPKKSAKATFSALPSLPRPPFPDYAHKPLLSGSVLKYLHSSENNQFEFILFLLFTYFA